MLTDLFVAWLESLRAFFAPYDKRLDDLLTFHGDVDPVKWECMLREAVKLPPPTGYDWPPAEDYAYPPQLQAMLLYQQPDPNVYSMPSPLFVAETVGDISWFYVLDLDHQRFHVLSGRSHAFCFPLDEVPHGKKFVRLMREVADLAPEESIDDLPGKATHGRSEPETCLGTASGRADDAVGEKDGTNDTVYPKAPRQIMIRITNTESVCLQLCRMTTVVRPDEPQRLANANLVVRKLIFNELVQKYKTFLCNHVSGYSCDDFIYREFVFTILSLAAGEFSLLEAGEVVRRKQDGRGIIIGRILAETHVNLLSAYRPYNDGLGSRGAVSEGLAAASDDCIPCFGRGAHQPNVAAGSAPTNVATFWLNNVVVHFCSTLAAADAGEGADHDNDNTSAAAAQLEAAVAETIRFVWQDSFNCRARARFGIIVSLARVVLFRIQPAATAPTTYCGGGAPRDTGLSGASPPVLVAVEHSDWLPLLVLRPMTIYDRRRTPHVAATFAAMARLFDEAAGAAQVGTTANAGALPDEVLQHVMDYADWRTRRAMARASASCAQYAATRVRFNVPGEVLSLAHLRPVTWKRGMHEYKGYVVGRRTSGRGRAEMAMGREKGKSVSQDKRACLDSDDAGGDDQGDNEMTWYVGTKSNRPWWHRDKAVEFFPVIGEGDRRSLLVETPCVLLRLETHLLIDREEDVDGGDDGRALD